MSNIMSIRESYDEIKKQTDKLAGQSPTVNSTLANWQSGTGTSGETGANLVTLGADNTKYKVLSLIISIHNLTNLAVITVRMYQQVNATERKVYHRQFVKGVDPNGLWVISGVVGIHEALRVELQSDTAGDNGLAVHYDYMLEAM